MATIPPRLAEPVVDYPTGDGKPVGETVTHRDNLFALIAMLRSRFAGVPDVYVSGNMMMYYVRYDPLYEYLDLPLRGFRRRGGEFVPIEPVDGRLPSQVIGLHLEDGGANDLRLHDPATGLWLPTWEEVEAGWVDVKARLGEQEAELRRAEEEVRRLRRIEEEDAQLRRELESLRRGMPGPS